MPQMVVITCVNYKITLYFCNLYFAKFSQQLILEVNSKILLHSINTIIRGVINIEKNLLLFSGFHDGYFRKLT